MFRLSDKLARLEDRISGRWGKKLDRFFDRRKGKWKFYIPLGLFCWYFYGMLINSVHLGIKSTFNATGDPVGSIWVVNPFRNLLAVFTPTGLGVTAVGFILFCLITKKGYIWFSGYKFIRDKRGFDILPDGTHGTSGFMSKKEQEKILLTGPISELSGTLLGKLKDDPDDDDKYAEYVTCLLYTSTLIEVIADDPDTLEQRVTAVETLCVASDMLAKRCEYKHEAAFLSFLPLLISDPDIERKSRRNALTSGVAASFPFASFELSDQKGIFLGLNLYNLSLIHISRALTQSLFMLRGGMPYEKSSGPSQA